GRHHARSAMRTLSYGGSEGRTRLGSCRPLQTPTPGETSAPGPPGPQPGQRAPPVCGGGVFPLAALPPERGKGASLWPPRSGGDGCERAREGEKLSRSPLRSDELDRERTHAETQRDQRSLGTENESEAQGRERRGEDARQRDRCDRLGSETFERRMPTVTR